jgi:DNA-binding response OmpR family regulator
MQQGSIGQYQGAAPTARHILVVDDDPEIRDYLELTLASQGYRVSMAGDGKEMRRIMASEEFDLVVLDRGLPGEDGLELARALRARSDIGIIMLTALGAPEDRVDGLDVGADDYVAKPFHTTELMARVRSVLRRQGKQPDLGGTTKAVTFAGWRLDFTRRVLSAPDGAAIDLTTAEFNLLGAFVSHPQRVLNRDRLTELVAERAWSPNDRSVDVLIAKLRRKIEADPKKPQLIKTVRQRGYTLTAPVAPADPV